MHQLLAATVLMATAVCSVSAQRGGPDTLKTAAMVQESRAAAAAGLDTLRALAVANYTTLGFNDATQASGATLSTPMVEYYVRLDSLKAFGPGANPLKLLAGGDRVVYPVSADGAVRSSIEVARDRGGWRPVAYGGATLVTALARQRSHLATAGRAEADYFIVRVPALGLIFLGTNAGGNLMLTPLANDSRERWRAGTPIPARDLFVQLGADARASNGLPM
jgi:hypothetical protein